MSAAGAAAAAQSGAVSRLHPALDSQSALAEANRCLFCFDAPCTAACPTHIDVPRFIKKIASGNLRGSALTILDANILGLSCSRVCPVDVLCEGACVMHRYNQKPIEIGRLQRYAMDRFLCRAARACRLPPRRRSHVRVACVGGGPASLACAAELRRHGYRGHHLRQPAAARRAEHLRRRGIQAARPPTACAKWSWCARWAWNSGRPKWAARCRSKIWSASSRSSSWAWAWAPWSGSAFPAKSCAASSTRCASSSATRRAPDFAVGRRVVVIGGGNTAIDAANAARRLGAEEVHLFYRRTETEMPAFAFEYDHSKVEGVRFHWLAQPVEIVGARRPRGRREIRARRSWASPTRAAGARPSRCPARSSNSPATW